MGNRHRKQPNDVISLLTSESRPQRRNYEFFRYNIGAKDGLTQGSSLRIMVLFAITYLTVGLSPISSYSQDQVEIVKVLTFTNVQEEKYGIMGTVVRGSSTWSLFKDNQTDVLVWMLTVDGLKPRGYLVESYQPFRDQIDSGAIYECTEVETGFPVSIGYIRNNQRGEALNITFGDNLKLFFSN